MGLRLLRDVRGTLESSKLFKALRWSICDIVTSSCSLKATCSLIGISSTASNLLKETESTPVIWLTDQWLTRNDKDSRNKCGIGRNISTVPRNAGRATMAMLDLWGTMAYRNPPFKLPLQAQINHIKPVCVHTPHTRRYNIINSGQIPQRGFSTEGFDWRAFDRGIWIGHRQTTRLAAVLCSGDAHREALINR